MGKFHVDISIIIVNYRSWEALEKCLIAIDSIVLATTQFEIIVVDNFSNDGELEAFSIKFPNFKFVLNSHNAGFAHACNIGAQHSKGEFLLFLNPDTIIVKEALKTLLTTAHNNPEFKLLSCNKVDSKGRLEKNNKPFPALVLLFGLTRAIFYQLNNSNSSQTAGLNHDIVSWLSGSLIMMSRQWFDKIEGWNEDYWLYYEDVDLSKRTQELHGKIVTINNLSIVHNHGGATRLNIRTKGLTKAEVIISRHVYINNNFNGLEKITAQILLCLSVLIGKTFLLTVSIPLFFIPKLHVNIYIFKFLISHYQHAIKNKTWLSARSINFKKARL